MDKSGDAPSTPRAAVFGPLTTTLTVFIAFGLVVALAAMAVGRANGGTAASATETASLTAKVTLSDYKVGPAAITVAAGGSLEITNAGAVQHNLAIDGQTLATPMLDAGGTATLALGGLAPGTYTVYCAVPGHRAMGMEAKLTVVGGTTKSAAMPGMVMGASASSGSGSGSDSSASTPTTIDSAKMDEVMGATTKQFPAKTAGLGAQNLAPKVLADGTKEFDLTAKVVKWEVSPGKTIDAWAYNGTVPGPTIKVDPGDKVAIVLKNELPESTVIHFHGIEVPNSMDGVPFITQDPIHPGETFTYKFTAQSTPAVGMYHSHFDATKQVSDGMLGPFLIGEEPVPAGVTVAQESSMVLNDSGTVGLTLNGKSFPATAPVVAKLGDWIEVHYMNEGQMAHPMHLHGMGQLVIAQDGYPVPQPYEVDTLNVSPGQRFTVLIHADQPGTWAWHCHILSHAENDSGMFGMVTALIVK